MLVTRPDPGGTATAARLARAGWTPVVAPMLHITPLAASLPSVPPGAVQAVLVTSAQALAALPETLRGVTLFAVGDATAERARRAGFTDVTSASGDADALAALAAARLDPAGRALLLASGRGRGGALVTALRRRGFRVLRRVAYEAVPAPSLPDAACDALAQGDVRAALFFSAETARAFVRVIPDALRPSLAGVTALAIGEPAAAALRPLPWRAVRVALQPTQDGLLALL